jgi:hypothetical protein
MPAQVQAELLFAARAGERRKGTGDEHFGGAECAPMGNFRLMQ